MQYDDNLNAENLPQPLQQKNYNKTNSKFNCLMLLRFRTPITKPVPRGTTSTLIGGLTPRTSYTVSVSYKLYFFQQVQISVLVSYTEDQI